VPNGSDQSPGTIEPGPASATKNGLGIGENGRKAGAQGALAGPSAQGPYAHKEAARGHIHSARMPITLPACVACVGGSVCGGCVCGCDVYRVLCVSGVCVRVLLECGCACEVRSGAHTQMTARVRVCTCAGGRVWVGDRQRLCGQARVAAQRHAEQGQAHR
jgi:hypothetical protein